MEPKSEQKPEQKSRLGFIGLGIMGKPMARNLLAAEYEVYGYDISSDNVKAVDGMIACSSVAEVADACTCIITMLPDSPQVKEVAAELAKSAKANTLLVDMSSIAPLASQEVAALLNKKSVRYIDAPVSGGEPKAIDGTLSIMVGGSEADFLEARPILECMGASIVHTGTVGSGNTTKLANQIIVALNIAAIGEAFNLAKKAGVDPSTVFEAIKGGLAGSTAMNMKLPMMLAENFAPGFKIDLHYKDLNNAIETAKAIDAPLLLTPYVQNMMEAIRQNGDGQLDHSALIKYYQKNQV